MIPLLVSDLPNPQGLTGVHLLRFHCRAACPADIGRRCTSAPVVGGNVEVDVVPRGVALPGAGMPHNKLQFQGAEGA